VSPFNTVVSSSGFEHTANQNLAFVRLSRKVLSEVCAMKPTFEELFLTVSISLAPALKKKVSSLINGGTRNVL
jgi:hypothetical protein